MMNLKKDESKINDRIKLIDSAVKEIKEKYGEGSIMKLGEARRVDVDVIPTGSISLDVALGVMGMPRGRIIEIYGPESSGKTTLALHIVAEAQKQGGQAAYVDAEHALDPEYAKKIGVNTKDLLISQPDYGEQALAIVETLVKSGAMDVIVVDSVAALTPKAELEGDMGQQHMGLQARLMSHAMRKLTALLARSKTVLIFINQIRMKIGIMFGNPEETPGGRALKFASSVRIDIRRTAKVQKGEEIIGNRVRVKVVKNKVAPPHREAEFDILYNEGISRFADLINSGVKYRILARSGTWYNFDKIKLGQGLDSARGFLKENGKIANEISKKIREVAFKGEA
jgi:recombination protein RecA